MSERAIGFPNVPGVYSEEQISGWRRVTDAVHALGGRIVLQLWHTGAASHPDHLGGALPAGPSAVDPRERTYTPGGPKATLTPREMTVTEIRDTVAEYRTAAVNARRAGFDGVEVHALGPFLIPQFLNPRLNRRRDAYGGDRAGRRRLLMEIVDAAATAWDGRRVGVRLSPYWTAERSPPTSGRSPTTTGWWRSCATTPWPICICGDRPPPRPAPPRTTTPSPATAASSTAR
ncbi:hypothetical protein [Streptomyces iranensis]|uniref:oxidoreductase n=1 Tax=Streptomyces iranensis TaxID=576784 RepID=UPI0039B76176